MSLPVLSYWVPGIAVAKGSMRAFYVKNLNRAVMTNDSSKTKSWASVVSLATAAEVQRTLWPITERAVSVRLRFNLPRPAGHYGSGKNAGKVKASAPTNIVTKPDVDKLTRCLLDALTGIVWRDDSQVVALDVRKDYAIGQPGVAITVEQYAP